ncbi:hypothetical protein TSOC_003112 [Tetrabaena socialis]|uniref:Reverse transcriptase domain-containing protein n=1 Tax=Tetrabaena socialis TaxID=47790 RepID=A0A2J8ACC1_9CHLO|nr:hypothetical protein TSOC_003112 [Tetrabaena socialis]|eukprot:PNH10171.1 hypothetical protein TSOC_003112 [Tetrabaena socialis]
MGESPYNLMSFMKNYSSQAHRDAHDALLKCLFWIGEGLGRFDGVTFVWLSLGVRFIPEDGSLCVMNASAVEHGTEACAPAELPAAAARWCAVFFTRAQDLALSAQLHKGSLNHPAEWSQLQQVVAEARRGDPAVKVKGLEGLCRQASALKQFLMDQKDAEVAVVSKLGAHGHGWRKASGQGNSGKAAASSALRLGRCLLEGSLASNSSLGCSRLAPSQPLDLQVCTTGRPTVVLGVDPVDAPSSSCVLAAHTVMRLEARARIKVLFGELQTLGAFTQFCAAGFVLVGPARRKNEKPWHQLGLGPNVVLVSQFPVHLCGSGNQMRARVFAIAAPGTLVGSGCIPIGALAAGMVPLGVWRGARVAIRLLHPLQDLPPNGFLGKRDLASGFHHVKLAPEARRYMGFHHPVSGRLQRWVVLPFGASQSPPIFVEVTAAARTIFQAECDARGLNVKIFVYVDDFMLLGAAWSDVRGAFEVLDEVGGELGLEWKLAKDRGRDEPLQQLEFLGLLFDTVRQQMSIAPSKRERYCAAVQHLLSAAQSSSRVRRQVLAATVGKLAFVAQACRWGFGFLQGLFDALYASDANTVLLPPDACDDLAAWEQILRSDNSCWDGVKSLTTSSMDLVGGEFRGADGAVIFTDASGQGYGAAWEAEELQGVWAADQRQLHIAWLELTAILQALRTFGPQLQRRRVLIRCDNTQAVAAVTRGATRIREGRAICRQIALLAVHHGFEVRAEHIRGVDNVRADRLSRHLEAARHQQLRLRPGVFARLCPAGTSYAPIVDCCCDDAGSNAQAGCREFFSPARSVVGQAAALAGKVLWAFPPAELVGEVLEEVQAAARQDTQRTRATVVVPKWPERSWFPRFVRGRRSPFRLDLTLPAGRCYCLWPSGREADASPYDLLDPLRCLWPPVPAMPAGGRCQHGHFGARSYHRECLDLAASAYAGGWFMCGLCVLGAAGADPWRAAGPALCLAAEYVGLAGAAVALDSADTYRSHRRRFVRFCEEQLGLLEEQALPTAREATLNPMLLCLFITYAASRYAASTVEGTLSALSDWERSRGVAAAECARQHPRVRTALRRALRERRQPSPEGNSVKAPVTVGLLRLAVAWLWQGAQRQPGSGPQNACDACWIAVGFFGMLRRSELHALTLADVVAVPGGGVHVRIRRSKTDQLGRGAWVILAETSGSGVPIGRIVQRHLDFLGQRGFVGGSPLFPRVTTGPAVGAVAMAKGAFTAGLRGVFARLQIEFPNLRMNLGLFSAHSLRRGGAIAAAEAGVSRELLKLHGRWRSDAVDAYLQASLATRLSVVGSM